MQYGGKVEFSFRFDNEILQQAFTEKMQELSDTFAFPLRINTRISYINATSVVNGKYGADIFEFINNMDTFQNINITDSKKFYHISRFLDNIQYNYNGNFQKLMSLVKDFNELFYESDKSYNRVFYGYQW